MLLGGLVFMIMMWIKWKKYLHAKKKTICADDSGCPEGKRCGSNNFCVPRLNIREITSTPTSSDIGQKADARAEIMEERDPMTDFRLFLVSSNCPKLTDKEIEDLTNLFD